VRLPKDDAANRPPNSIDWKQVKHLSFLEVSYNITMRLSGTSYMIFDLLFYEIVVIHIMLEHLEQCAETIDASDEESEKIISGDINFREMTKRMRMKYDKYYGTPEKMNPLVYIALIFDPRYKLVS